MQDLFLLGMMREQNMRETKYPPNSDLVGGTVIGLLQDTFCLYTRHAHLKSTKQERQSHFQRNKVAAWKLLQIRCHRANTSLYRSVITLIAHFSMRGQTLMPATAMHPVGLDLCNWGWHLAHRLFMDNNLEVFRER